MQEVIREHTLYSRGGKKMETKILPTTTKTKERKPKKKKSIRNGGRGLKGGERGRYGAATQVKGLSPEITIVSAADTVH